MLWLTPACIIWAFAYVSVGSAAAEGYRSISGQLSSAAYFFVAAIVLPRRPVDFVCWPRTRMHQ